MDNRHSAQEAIGYSIANSTLGRVLVARSAAGVCAVLLGDDPAELTTDLERRFPGALLAGEDAEAALAADRVIAYIEDPHEGFDLQLDPRGTEFRLRVWRALRDIPVGETTGYQQIAERIGMPKATRAVASACAANPIAVAIPCHRVVRSDGSLSGYRWGVERKRALLDRESRHTRGPAGS